MSQLEIEHVYEARGGAAGLFLCHDPEVLMDGPAGTGKTRATLQKVADLCEAYPGVRALIARQTRTSCTESILVTLERDVIWGFPWELGDGHRANRTHYACRNGSQIVVGGLDKPERLYSTEWDIVYIAEAIETSEDAWERFARAMRNHRIPKGIGGGPQQPGEERAMEPHPLTGQLVPAFWTQRIADTNPGPPSHWLNQRCLRGQMTRILSRHADNPSLSADFLDGLRRLTGHRRARLYEGRWVAAEGSVFGAEFDEARNVVAPFQVPDDWPQWVYVDPGYDHPCAILWIARGYNGTLYVCHELYRGGKRVSEHAADIKAANAGRHVVGYALDPRHGFSSTAQSPETIAEQFYACGLSFCPWQRKEGAGVESAVNLVREALVTGRLKVFRSCVNTINEFQSWSYKRTAGGDLPGGDDAFEDKNNHAMDALMGFFLDRHGDGDGAIRVSDEDDGE